jgi:hypothetical protein
MRKMQPGSLVYSTTDCQRRSAPSILRMMRCTQECRRLPTAGPMNCNRPSVGIGSVRAALPQRYNPLICCGFQSVPSVRQRTIHGAQAGDLGPPPLVPARILRPLEREKEPVSFPVDCGDLGQIALAILHQRGRLRRRWECRTSTASAISPRRQRVLVRLRPDRTERRRSAPRSVGGAQGHARQLRPPLNERYLPSPITSYERETAAEVYQRQDRGVSTVRRYRLHRDIKSVAERLPRRGRLSGYVQELSCLSTTHKEK